MNKNRKKSATISVLPKAIRDYQRSLSNYNADATDPSGNADEHGYKNICENS